MIRIYQLDFSGKLNFVGEVEGGIMNKCNKCVIAHAECISESKTIKFNDDNEVIECSGFIGEDDA